MPFQPINFAQIRPQGAPFFRDLAQNLAQGLQLGRMPEQLQQKSEMNRLANAMSQLKLQQEPERFSAEQGSSGILSQLRQAQLQQAQKDLQDPFGGQIPPGEVGQAYWLDRIGQQYGEDSSIFKNAQQALQQKTELADSLKDYRLSLTQTAGKRGATNLGKLQTERDEVAQGFVPNTNMSTPLDPQKQSTLLDQYDLQIQKSVSDTDARKKALSASNIDKTIEQINVDDLTKYAGANGALKLKLEEGRAPLGKESESYRKYLQAQNNAKLLAKQVRQFYGDSIQPEILNKLEKVVDPATWRNNPKIAKQLFNSLANVLRRETQTYRGALKSTREYEMPKYDTDATRPIAGTVRLYKDGEPYDIPESKASSALERGFSRDR